MSPSYVNKIENGENEPSLKAFAAIARELEMNSGEVMFIVRHLSE